MIKVKLTNRLAQALPVLVKVPGSPGKLRQISIPRKRAKLIREDELSVHCQELYDRGYLTIKRTGKVAPAPEEKVEAEKPVENKVAAPAPKAKAPARKSKKTTRSRAKKGKK